MSLKYVTVKIKRPENLQSKNLPGYVELWAIEACEQPETVPQGESPIIWRLLTTHPITGVSQAMKCLEWYSNRWFIEELFRIIKSKGFELEASQLETGAALKKQVVMALQVALTIMVLKLSLNKKEAIKAELAFNQQQIEFIELLLKKEIDGKTIKQQNPYPYRSLAWCAWTIGQLIISLIEKGSQERTKPLTWAFYNALNEHRVAMRTDDWKILCRLKNDTTNIPMIQNLYEGNEDFVKEADLVDFELYNMKEGISEAENVAEKYPEVFEKMKKQLKSEYTDLLEGSFIWERE